MEQAQQDAEKLQIKLHQEAVGGSPQPLFYAKREKYVDYRKRFKYGVSKEAY